MASSVQNLEELLSKLKSIDLLQEIYNNVNRQINLSNIILILHKLSEITPVDVEEALHYFEYELKAEESKQDICRELSAQDIRQILQSYCVQKLQQSGSNFDHKDVVREHGNSDDTLTEDPKWLVNKIVLNEATLKELFESYQHPKLAMVDVRELSHILREFTQIVDTNVSFKAFGKFSEVLNSSFPPQVSSDGRKQFLSVNFDKFYEIVTEWAGKFAFEQDDFGVYLALSIQEYQDRQASLNSVGVKSQKIDKLIKSLQKLLEEYEAAKNLPVLSPLEKKQDAIIKHLFKLYAKTSIQAGHKTTFRDIEAHQHKWSITHFFRFCRDFGILGKQQGGQRKIDKKKLTEIYKKTAINTITMDLQHFIDSLSVLANIYYNKIYDQLQIEPLIVSTLDSEAKRKKFYFKLGFDMQDTYKQYIKHLGDNFGKEAPRISDNERGLNYKFKLSQQQQQKLEQWRKRKQNQSQPPQYSDDELYSTKKPLRTPIIQNKSLIAPNAQGYSMRFRQSDFQGPREKREVNQSMDMPAPYNEEPAEVEDDEVFLRYFPGAERQKLEGILRMHDERLNKAQRAVNRSYRFAR